MTASTLCFACQDPVLIVTTDTGTRSLEPTPDPTGTVEIRRSGLGWRGRFVGKNTAPAPGWTKARTHTCKQPLEAPMPEAPTVPAGFGILDNARGLLDLQPSGPTAFPVVLAVHARDYMATSYALTTDEARTLAKHLLVLADALEQTRS